MFRHPLKLCRTSFLDSAKSFINPQLTASQILRKHSSNSSPLPIPETEKWTTIYIHKGIGTIAIVSNLKFHQVIGTTVAVAVIGIAEHMSYVISGATTATAAMGIGTGLGLCLYSGFFLNTVGFVYVCPKIENIRLAYINFWGKRKEEEMPIQDMKIPEDRTKLILYLPITSPSSSRTYKLFHKSGELIEPEVFSFIFNNNQPDTQGGKNDDNECQKS